jgi:hypothetical protein
MAPPSSMTPIIPGFVHLADALGSQITLYTPDSPSPGELVIMCSWLGAIPKHIAKYVALYQSIAPGARILLLESNYAMTVTSYHYQRQAALPAVSVILEALATPVNKVLLHCFSNGGCYKATQLLLITREHFGSPLQLIGMVFDSSPNAGGYWKTYYSMVDSLPKGFATQILGSITCHAMLILFCSWTENPASLQRRIMIDPTVIRVPSACYLYSKSDQVCDWREVHDHAEDARGKGWMVEEEIFNDTAHCTHLSGDPLRYEASLQKIWGVGDRGTDADVNDVEGILSKL